MKKIVITVVTLLVAGVLIGMVLTNNKKENQAKIDVINQNTGAAPVQVVEVAMDTINEAFTANGNFIPHQELELKSENSGRVTGIRVKEGDRVRRGQVLATIDEKYLSLDLQTARDAYEKLKTDRERYASSFKTGGVTQAQLDEIDLQLRNAAVRLEQAQRRIGDAHIKAPIGGIINKKLIEVGAYLAPGTPLFEIVDVSSLRLTVAVNERQVVRLQQGDRVKITVPVFPDKEFTGTIYFISAKADAALNFPVEVKVENKHDDLIKAGMYATASFAPTQSKSALIIPRTAFIGSVKNQEVYVLNENNQVTLRKVTAGSVLGDSVEILDGLKAGEKVVVTGQINLTNGAKVEVQQG